MIDFLEHTANEQHMKEMASYLGDDDSDVNFLQNNMFYDYIFDPKNGTDLVDIMEIFNERR